jgi:uncharacterized DUF497 family protein
MGQEEKSREPEKHGVSFELAQEIFDNPLALSKLGRMVGSEERRRTLGMVEGIVLLLVTHTARHDEDEEIIRIISARKATAHERRHYEQD